MDEISDDLSLLTASNTSYPGGVAMKITETASNECTLNPGSDYAKYYKFRYSIVNTQGDYIGENPPPELNYADLDRMNLLLSSERTADFIIIK